MKQVSRYFAALFPYIATLVLWRLSSPIFNPAGVLCIIPIFYYSFIRTRPYFLPFAILGCFLLDYNFDTMLFWTILFCMAYAANGFQSHIDLTRQKAGGAYIFMFFIGLGLFLQGVWSVFVTMSAWPMFQTIWLFLWTSVLYIPFIRIAGK